MTNTNNTRYLVRSNVNPTLILCTDGKFHGEEFTGPGRDLSAKLYKTQRGAQAVRGGSVIVRRCDTLGVDAA